MPYRGLILKLLIWPGSLVLALGLFLTGHYLLAKVQGAKLERDWKNSAEPQDLNALTLAELTPNQRYFSQNPYLQAQVQFTPVEGSLTGEVIYENPQLQQLLVAALEPSRVRRSLRSDLRQQEYTDFPEIAKELKLPSPEVNSAQKVRDWLSRQDEIFTSLVESAGFPPGHFGMPWTAEDATTVSTPHYIQWIQLVQVSSLRAQAALALSQSPQAWEELRVAFRLAETLQADPVVLATMVHSGMQRLILNEIWEGLAHRAWEPTELEALNQELASWTPAEDYVRAIQGDRILAFRSSNRRLTPIEWDNLELSLGLEIPWWVRSVPGIAEYNGINSFRFQSRYCIQAVGTRDWALVEEGRRLLLEKDYQDPHWFVAQNSCSMLVDLAVQKAEILCYSVLARTAVALERHYQDNGDYPKSLQGLVPAYLDAILEDPMDGQPLGYLRTEDGRYRLHSKGWNLIDDLGKSTSETSTDPLLGAQRDWAWQYPS